MKIVSYNDIKNLNIDPILYYDWIDAILRKREHCIMPTKTKIAMRKSDYFNVMPSAIPEDNVLGLKVINRNDKRRNSGGLNLDSQIYLYDYENCNLKAILDGNYITTMRTAAVAVHTLLNLQPDFSTIAMVGLGNIQMAIGDILFKKLNGKNYTVKLFKYKEQELDFIERFNQYKNINFILCDSYQELMKDSDVVLSCVSYIENDFCDESVYKKGCLIIPVHMRGFMQCDLTFDHIIASDMERIKSFKYYDKFKKLSYTDDVLFNGKKLRDSKDDRVIVYNLGLSITDLYFAGKIFELLNDKKLDVNIDLGPQNKYYV